MREKRKSALRQNIINNPLWGDLVILDPFYAKGQHLRREGFLPVHANLGAGHDQNPG